MSHKEYVSECDEDQLKALIDQANSRLAQIRQSGWVKLWTVSLGWANIGWFALDDYEAAVAFGAEAVLGQLSEPPRTRGIELKIELERYRPEEVPELLKRTPAPRAKSPSETTTPSAPDAAA